MPSLDSSTIFARRAEPARIDEHRAQLCSAATSLSRTGNRITTSMPDGLEKEIQCQDDTLTEH